MVRQAERLELIRGEVLALVALSHCDVAPALKADALRRTRWPPAAPTKPTRRGWIFGRSPERGFVRTNNVEWDVKAPRSREAIIEHIKAAARARGKPEPTLDPGRPQKGEFTVTDTMKEIRGEIAARENVIIDTRHMNGADTAALRKAVTDAGVSDKVKFYPS